MGEKITDYENIRLSGSEREDVALFRQIFVRDDMLRIRRLKPKCTDLSCTLLYMDGMIKGETLNEAVVKPIVTAVVPDITPDAEFVEKSILFANDVKPVEKVSDMLQSMLYGDSLLIIDGSKKALVIDTKGWRTRGISEPEDERILQGPREGFDEAAMLSVAMIRRKLITPDLCVELMRVGRRTDTSVYICYLGSLADPAAVDELKRRISRIDIDGILDTNYIAEYVRDHKRSLFKTTGSTERPDIVVARLLEGRIAVIVDGTPVVLTLPYLFSENFQSDEDYYLNFLVASIGRMLRYICFFFAVSVPALFVALTTFHIKLLPTDFALSIAQLRGGVPLSSAAECIMLIFVFEILKETGVRMPQSLGHALSIVGGLVVGQAAVEARIISAPMLIAVALSGISGLMIPRLKGIVFYLRIALVVLAALLGIYGYLIGITAFLLRLFSLSSFGVDYTVSLRRPDSQGLKDIFWRAPWPVMRLRPMFNRNIVRSRKEEP